jgi:pimeloyl-ACP methyl ester carboxylesterase
MTLLDVDGASLYYETDGRPGDPALLLIHAGIAHLRMWDPQIAALSAHHFVVRFDTRGFGGTTTDDVPFSNRADVAALLDHLDIAAATVVGASRGGGIAIDLALDSPARVLGLVTIGSGPSGHPAVQLTDREEQLFERVDEVFERGDVEQAYRLETELWCFGPLREADDLDPGFVATAYALNQSNVGHAFERPVPQGLEPAAYARLGEIAVPSLHVVGDSDISAALVQHEYLVGAIAGAESSIVPDAAHLPSVEKPAEFEALLVWWLARHHL